MHEKEAQDDAANQLTGNTKELVKQYLHQNFDDKGLRESMKSVTQESDSELKKLQGRQDIKWIQYLPTKFEKGEDIDSAIKAIYTPRYTNISENQDLRPKFGKRDGISSPRAMKSYLYGK